MEKPYQVYIEDARKLFEDWIARRGGVIVWENVNLSDPCAGAVFTPAHDPKGKPYSHEHPPKWTHRYLETCTDLKDFRFAKSLKEVKRFRIATRMGTQGLMVKLTDASSEKLKKELEKAGPDAGFHFDYDTQEAVIEVPIWEDVVVP